MKYYMDKTWCRTENCKHYRECEKAQPYAMRKQAKECPVVWDKYGKIKPKTNEEWLKSLDTEGLVDHLYEVHKGGASVERQMWIEEHKERIKMQFRGWLKEKHDESV